MCRAAMAIANTAYVSSRPNGVRVNNRHNTGNASIMFNPSAPGGFPLSPVTAKVEKIGARCQQATQPGRCTALDQRGRHALAMEHPEGFRYFRNPMCGGERRSLFELRRRDRRAPPRQRTAKQQKSTGIAIVSSTAAAFYGFCIAMLLWQLPQINRGTRPDGYCASRFGVGRGHRKPYPLHFLHCLVRAPPFRVESALALSDSKTFNAALMGPAVADHTRVAVSAAVATRVQSTKDSLSLQCGQWQGMVSLSTRIAIGRLQSSGKGRGSTR